MRVLCERDTRVCGGATHHGYRRGTEEGICLGLALWPAAGFAAGGLRNNNSNCPRPWPCGPSPPAFLQAVMTR